MCLIVFAYKVHPKYKLILAANRDEYYDRPASVAGWWEDKPEILGGKDLKALGTWMAISKSGRFAAVTNYRDIHSIRDEARSRGDLPVGFISGNATAFEYGTVVRSRAEEYNGFNLLAYDEEMIHFSNYENRLNELKPGIYGLSNALLDTPWPKVEQAKADLSRLIKDEFDLSQLAELLMQTETAPEESLPDTGISKEMEKALSAMCIRTPNYGTCCSTALLIGNDATVSFMEKSYPVGDRTDTAVSFEFAIDK